MSFDLSDYERQLARASAFLTAELASFPQLAVVTGTGLGELTDGMSGISVIPYADIPHFPVSTVPGHAGRLLHGVCAGAHVLVLQGRFHLYEGYPPHVVAFPVRVLARCGVRSLILTNAAGGLNPDFRAGDLMLIADHLNLTGVSPLAGPHDPAWGARFPDMTAVYDPQLRTRLLAAARRCGIRLRSGIYVGIHGPSLETPAETRFYRNAGADAIGMSTVTEATAAVQSGLRVAGVAAITNVNDPDNMTPIAVEDVLEVAAAAAPLLGRLLHELLADGKEPASA